MKADYLEQVRALSIEKALAVAAYAESVAAYRYRTLAEKTSSEANRQLFEQLADEEQSHHTRMRDLLESNFPGSDFVLTQTDKELIIVGPRMIDVTDRESIEQAREMIFQSERLTGRFYAAVHEVTTRNELKPALQEMALECQKHAQRVKTMSLPV